MFGKPEFNNEGSMKRRQQKPKATIRDHAKVRIYKAKFQPFESIKYLNVAALKNAKKVPIQIGTIQAAGMTATVEAEVRKGLITKIRPVGCENCGPRKSKGRASGVFKKVVRDALKRVRALGEPAVKLPVSVSQLTRTHIDFGPVFITWFGDIPRLSMCITVHYTDGVICTFCQHFSYPICSGPSN
jgi:hypothetical protein